MWIRLLLQPLWIRTVFWIGWILFWVLALAAYTRWDHGGDANPFTLPMLAIVLIAAGCVGVGALCAVLETSRRNRYLRALDGTVTAVERSQAISAAMRGPMPDNPRVQVAARRVADLQLTAYRKNPQTYRIIYPLLSVVWVVLFGLSVRDPAPQVVFNGVQAAFWISVTIWIRLSWRRLEHRVELLRSAVAD